LKLASIISFLCNMKKYVQILYILFIPCLLLAQPAYDLKRDFMWKLGYGGNPNIGVRYMILDFRDQTLDTINYWGPGLDNAYMNASMCDVNGNLLFYSNGCAIADSAGQTLPGGADLNPGVFSYICSNDGYIGPQAMMALPVAENEFFLLYMGADFTNEPQALIDMRRLYQGRISRDSSNGSLTYQPGGLLLNDTLFGNMDACRHANGRDWWVLVPEAKSKRFFRWLVTPNGIHSDGGQYIGIKKVYEEQATGMVAFSPDGNWFAQYSLKADLQLFRFDRCNGLLSEPRHVPILDAADTILAAGVAFSPNSRWLYATSSNYIYQFDTQAADLAASKQTVAVYDGFVTPGGGTTQFYIAQNAPDGTIVVTAPGGKSAVHVIEQPDSTGIACQVVQHKFVLPAPIGYGLPNHPDYRLGPLAGSGCDSLSAGPLAAFSHSAVALDVQFRDSSLYWPTQWQWDFGDGGSSAARHPAHLYAAAGDYAVCLWVSGPFGTDSLCRTVSVQPSASNELDSGSDELPNAWPNPSPGGFRLWLPKGSRYGWALYSPTGDKITSRENALPGLQQITTDGLPDGIYYLQIMNATGRLWSKKLVLLKQ
jgi:PKD repeat protein